MTLPVQVPQIEYAEDGVSTSFPVPFRYRDPAHIRAERVAADGTVTALVAGVDYSLGTGDTASGGTLTVTVAAAAGVTLVIWRETPLKSDGDYETTGAFQAQSHEDLLDEAAMRDQDQQLQLDRAPKVPRGESIGPMPALSQRQGDLTGATAAITYAAYDAAGNPTVDTPDNFAAPAAAEADRAETGRLGSESARDAAIAYLNPHADQAAGEAATSEGELFSYLDGNDEIALAKRTAGGSEVLPAYFGAAKVGLSTGGTVKDGFDRAPWIERLLSNNVKADYDRLGNSGTDDAAALQAIIDHADANRLPKIYLPTFNKDYLIQSTLLVNDPDVEICGDKPTTYNRGLANYGGRYNKLGSIVLGSSCTVGLQLGDEGLPVDQTQTVINGCFTVKNLGFRKAGVDGDGYDKTQTAILFDRQTNGPDRPVHIEGVSAHRMAYGFNTGPQEAGTSICIANLQFTNCNFSNNKIGIGAQAPVYGLSVRNSQIEQNNDGTNGASGQTGGGIHGDFGGAVSICDNMLEGQPNPINLQPSGAALQVNISGNYIEKNNVNGGTYVYRMGTNFVFLTNSLRLSQNFNSGTALPADYLVINKSGNWIVENWDRQGTVTFENFSGTISRGSNLLPPGFDHFKIASLNGAVKFPEIYMGDAYSRQDTSGGSLTSITGLSGGSGYTDGETVDIQGTYGFGASGTATVSAGAITSIALTGNGRLFKSGETLEIVGRTSGAANATATATVSAYGWSSVTFSDGFRFASPMGIIQARDATQHTALGFGGSAGDLIVINAYLFIDEMTSPLFRTQATTGSGAFVASLGDSQAHKMAPGQWAFISFPFILPSTQASLGFKFAFTTGSVKAYIGGLTAKNYGAFANDGSTRQSVVPMFPRL